MHLQVLVLLLLPLFCSASTSEQMVFPNQLDNEPTLADLLTIESSASIFFSYARELKLGNILSEKHPEITVLVPTNKAIMALARKPHQGPSIDDGIVITDEEFDTQSKNNVLKWVSAHIIPESAVDFQSKTYDTLLDGKSVKFETVGDSESGSPDWSRVQIDQDIHIVGSKKASNGIYYLVDGAVNVD